MNKSPSYSIICYINPYFHGTFTKHFLVHGIPGPPGASRAGSSAGSVLIVGAGGLGCPVALYLAAAGHTAGHTAKVWGVHHDEATEFLVI